MEHSAGNAAGDLVTELTSIHDLMRAVTAHPDYVFGTIFVKDDFPGGEVNWGEFGDAKWAEENIVAAGFEYIEFNARERDTEDHFKTNKEAAC